MAKLTEKMLYDVFLDLWYADKDNDDIIKEYAAIIKSARKKATRIKRLLKKAEEHYFEVHGKGAMPPRR